MKMTTPLPDPRVKQKRREVTQAVADINHLNQRIIKRLDTLSDNCENFHDSWFVVIKNHTGINLNNCHRIFNLLREFQKEHAFVAHRKALPISRVVCRLQKNILLHLELLNDMIGDKDALDAFKKQQETIMIQLLRIQESQPLPDDQFLNRLDTTLLKMRKTP